MLLTELLLPGMPTVAPSDTFDVARSLIKKHHVQHIPLVENGQYLGLIQIQDLKHEPQAHPLLSSGNFEQFKPAVSIHAHPFEALRIIYLHDLSLIPIVYQAFDYAGVITKEALVQYLVDNMSIEISGGIIVLELDPRNYSLSEIARICENEQVVIINAMMKTNIETAKLEVTIKTNRSDISAVIQSLERHEYTVLNFYGDKQMENDIVDRYKLLMNYINM
jgi:acetoin utilization protein AcuB